MTETAPQEPQQQEPAPEAPPWGDEFDAQRAWDLVQNLRGDKDKLKADLSKAQADQQELETLRNEKLSAAEKDLKAAAKKAADETRETVASEYRPKLHNAQFRAIAGPILGSKEAVDAVLATVDPSKFINDDGDVDEEKVAGHLTALTTVFGVSKTAPAQQAPRVWGQNSGGNPPSRPGAAGLAEAEKRFGKTS